MANWKPIEGAPKDGRSVLLWARLKAAPAEKAAPSYPIVGRWDNWQWQATPDLFEQCGADPNLLDRASAGASQVGAQGRAISVLARTTSIARGYRSRCALSADFMR